MEKERRVKWLVIVSLIVAVLGLTIAFAALSETLTINGTATLDAAKWGIKFENLTSGTKTGDAIVNNEATIASDKVTINNIDVTLKTPGDSVTYTVDLVNEGTINAEISNIKVPELTEEQKRYIDFKVTYDNGEEVTQGDILNSETTKNLTIKIEFKKDVEASDLPSEAQQISLSYKLDFVQTDEASTITTTPSITNNCTNFDKKDTYNVGDVIAICNSETGISEDFYVIHDDGDSVTALAKYNLYVGASYDIIDGEIIYPTIDPKDETLSLKELLLKYGISTSEKRYGIQNEISKGYIVCENCKMIGLLPFSEETYWVSDGKLLEKYGEEYPVYVFDSNSFLYSYLKDYESYLKSLG